MFEVVIKRQFAAAHQLRNYVGKCAQLHGHTWTVEVGLCGPRLDERGLLVDFTDLKRWLDEIVAELDHTNLNDHPYFAAEHNPSSEELARFFFDRLAAALPDSGVALQFARIWESPTAAATYRPSALAPTDQESHG